MELLQWEGTFQGLREDLSNTAMNSADLSGPASNCACPQGTLRGECESQPSDKATGPVAIKGLA